MSDWQKLDNRLVKVGWRWLDEKKFKLPNSNIGDFTVYDKPDTHYAGMIALTVDNQVIVVEQYRPGPEKMMLEIMGGGVEAGEDFKSAAVREMSEESGYKPREVIELGQVYKDAYNNATWHYYLALGCTQTGVGQKLESTEFAEVKLITIQEFINNAKTGKMTDTEAVLLAYDRLMELMKKDKIK